MKAWMGLALACAVGLAVAACETQGMKKSDGKMAADMLDAKAVMKAFKSGGACTWKSASGKTEDYYYTTEAAGAGDADRYMGDKSTPGHWAVKGDKLCLNFGGEVCYGLSKTGKGTYKATGPDGKTQDLKC